MLCCSVEIYSYLHRLTYFTYPIFLLCRPQEKKHTILYAIFDTIFNTSFREAAAPQAQDSLTTVSKSGQY